MLTSDRGLCGSFNSNIIRKTMRLIFDAKERYQNIKFSTIGKKGYEALKRENIEISRHYDANLENINIANATEISKQICSVYIKENLDAVWLVFNEFKSAISQKLTVKQMLPIKPIISKDTDIKQEIDYIYEPNKYEMLDYLLPKSMSTTLYQSFLDSAASEHGARMTAMENATRNAQEMCSSLTLQYNRARQAAITTELVEIISGAQAVG